MLICCVLYTVREIAVACRRVVTAEDLVGRTRTGTVQRCCVRVNGNLHCGTAYYYCSPYVNTHWGFGAAAIWRANRPRRGRIARSDGVLSTFFRAEPAEVPYRLPREAIV